jgi:hypothetical protein
MDNIKDMTNDEFISHLMTGYNKHGALVQMVIIDCLQRGLDQVQWIRKSSTTKPATSVVGTASSSTLNQMERLGTTTTSVKTAKPHGM